MKFLQEIPDEIYAAVEHLPSVNIYHRKPWHRTLRRALGWRVGAFVEHDAAGALAFYLPLVCKRGTGLKKSFIGLPLSHDVPALGETAEQPSERMMPLRVHGSVPETWAAKPDDSRVVSILDLTQAETFTQLKKIFRKGLERDARRAVNRDYTMDHEPSEEALTGFSRMQAETRRRQGSPTFPRRFFHVMAEELGEAFRLHLVRTKDGYPAAGVIFIYDGERAIYAYGASLASREYWREGVNQYAMFDAIETAYEAGMKSVDFGPTPKAFPNLLTYKEAWRAKSEDIVYSVVSRSAAGLQPDRQSAAMKIASGALKRLPLPVFETVSPILLRLAA